MKKNLILIFAALIAITAGYYARQLQQQAEQYRPDTLPDFSFPDSNGQLRNISEWRGKLLIINFWATWCAPCREEIPEFIALQDEYGDQGLQFIGIAIEPQQAVAEYMQSIAINYPMLIADEAGITLAQQLGNILNTVPFTLLVNRQGQVVHHHPGSFTRTQILEKIKPLL